MTGDLTVIRLAVVGFNGHSVRRLVRFIFLRVQPRTPWLRLPASPSVIPLGELQTNLSAQEAAQAV